MQIVVPMSGFGERFRRAGYEVPKPLIEVEGKPIIEHVVSLYPGDHEFVFVCNKDHLAEPGYAMEAALRRIKPGAKVLGIEPHKLGPVHAVLQVADELSKDLPTVVSYCDYGHRWDFEAFRRHVEETRCDGCVVTYSGFHPHMLHSTKFAYVRTEGQRVVEIQEKQPFTDRPMEEHASSGAYYFRSGGLMAECFARTVEQDLRVGGEYYVSLAYRPLLDQGGLVTWFDLDHFMQWGTPEDLLEYEYYSKMFRLLASKGETGREVGVAGRGTVMVPMAGAGSRFVKEGFETPKPLIEIDGEPMAVRAVRDLPDVDTHVFIMRSDISSNEAVSNSLSEQFPGTTVATVDGLTDGQARTCMAGLAHCEPDGPLTIGACDNGVIYDPADLDGLLADPEVDVIVWGARGYPGAIRFPEMYGWIDAEGGHVSRISVKAPLSSPRTDPVVVGAFTFRTPEIFAEAAARLFDRDGRVNGEFYVDSLINDCIELGYRTRLLEVESYLCWGTPDDLRRFRYWQACFSGWAAHPYTG